MMKTWFRNLPFGQKLFALLCTVSTVAVLLGVVSVLIHENYLTKKTLEDHIRLMGMVVASNCHAALEFGDKTSAQEALDSLHLEHSVEAACLYDANRKRFVYYQREDIVDEPLFPTKVNQPGVAVSFDLIELLTPVKDIDGTVGYLYLRADTKLWKHNVIVKIIIASVILVCALAVAAGLALWLQGFVTQPIIQLAAIAREVDVHRDYTTRVEYESKDEVGQLYAAFNDMMTRISAHEKAQYQAQEELEQRVATRTAELSQANMELHEEISKHELARRELEDTQMKLVTAARLAGMADIAAGVLHNVGNVLNSVNVRITVMLDRIKLASEEGDDLVACGTMLKENSEQLSDFLTQDDRGRYLPEFLDASANQMQTHWVEVSKDLKQVRDYFAHIRQIVASHQSMAKVSGTSSRFRLSELFDEAVQLNGAGLNRNSIEVKREYISDPVINADRHRILQVLVNLVSNAKHAIEMHQGKRSVTLSIEETMQGFVTAAVSDSGIGISTDDMKRVFQSGFTTKPQGHGFGLHTSAIAARELGGSLAAESKGKGHGSQFKLTLPKEPPAQKTVD